MQLGDMKNSSVQRRCCTLRGQLHACAAASARHLPRVVAGVADVSRPPSSIFQKCGDTVQTWAFKLLHWQLHRTTRRVRQVVLQYPQTYASAVTSWRLWSLLAPLCLTHMKLNTGGHRPSFRGHSTYRRGLPRRRGTDAPHRLGIGVLRGREVSGSTRGRGPPLQRVRFPS